MEKTFAPEEKYFYGREVKSITQMDMDEGKLHPQIAIEFADGKHEIVHEDEWKVASSDKENIPDLKDEFQRGEVLLHSTYGVQKSLMDSLRFHNTLCRNVDDVWERAKDTLNDFYLRAKSAVFGTDDWEVKLTISQIREVLKKNGVEAPELDLSDAQKAVLQLLEEKGVEYREIFNPRFFLGIALSIKRMESQAMASVFGKPVEDLRIEDWVSYVEEYVQNQQKPEGESASEESGDGKDSAVGEEQGSTPAESAGGSEQAQA